MFRAEYEFPNGTRCRLERDGAIWVATFAAFQFVIRPGEERNFEDRARVWCEGNIAGESLAIAYAVIRHFTELSKAVDAAAEEARALAEKRLAQ